MKELLELPIGDQGFGGLREDGFLYVDKTELIYRMTQKGKFYFLSRPRRFGKSLLLSTIEAYFLGKRELFDGLYLSQVEEEWAEHPVMHLDFSTQDYKTEKNLYNILNDFLDEYEAKYDGKEGETDVALRFKWLVRKAYEKTGRRVVILVDEYDKPLIETIDNPELQEQYRGVLRGFYAVLKAMSQYIRFALLTGITKFSKVSIFSDLNNLNDISRDRDYASICGITDAEVDSVLAPYIERYADEKGMKYDAVREDLRRMYDGYHFAAASPGLYNPFSVMCALSKRAMEGYWFDSGTPTMLVEMLKRKHYSLPTFEEPVSAMKLDNKTGDSDSIVPLLYQSGYLSIHRMSEDGRYWLTFPNDEVREGFFQFLMPYYASVPNNDAKIAMGDFVADVRNGDAEQFMKRLQSFFADYQYDTKMPSEAHFQNVMYILCKLLGLQVEIERRTSDGRIDMLMRTEKYVYIVECKIDSTADEALAQIKEKEYALPWAMDEREKVLIGLNFSTGKRRPDGWVIERGDGTIVRSSDQVTDQVTDHVSGHDTGHDAGHDAGRKSVRNRSEIGPKVGQKVEAVFALIKKNPEITREELSAALHMAPSSVQRYIDILKKDRIKRDGGDNGGAWVIIEE